MFLDLATMLSDSVADTKMSNITIIIIVLIVASIAVTITETSMRFNMLQKSKDRGKGDDSDPIDDQVLRMAPGVRTAAYQQLEGMAPDQRTAWVGNLSVGEKINLCGEDIICRTFAGV